MPKCTFLNATTKQFRIKAKPGTVLDIPAGCTANGPEFSIDRAAIDISNQLDTLYVTHNSFNFEKLLAVDGKENPTLSADIKKFVHEQSVKSKQELSLKTVEDLTAFHARIKKAALVAKASSKNTSKFAREMKSNDFYNVSEHQTFIKSTKIGIK